MSVPICQHCGAEQRRVDAKFCTQCGKSLEVQEQSEQTKPLLEDMRSQISGINLKNISIPLLGGIGIIIMGFALLQILSEVSIEIKPLQLMIFGWLTFIILLILGLIAQLRNYLDQGPVLIIHLTSMVILTATQYVADLIQRSSETRISMLVVAAILLTASYFISSKIDTSNFQEFARIIVMYVGWILMIYTSGSNFIERWLYTFVLTWMILLTNYSIINFKNLTGKTAYVIVEFIALLQTSVINSSLIVIISFVTILSFPLFMYLRKSQILEQQETELRILLIMIFLPQLSIIIAITNGALSSPFPHLLFVTFAIGWALYLQNIANNEVEYLSVISQIGLSFSIIFLIGTFVYSFTSTELDFIILLIGTVTITTLFSTKVAKKFSIAIKMLNILFISFAMFQLVSKGTYEFFVPILVFVVCIIINFSFELIHRNFTTLNLALLQLSTGLFLLVLYIVEFYGIVLVSIFNIVNFGFYFYIRLQNSHISFPLTVINFILPSIIITRHLTDFPIVFWILGASLLIFVILFLFDKKIEKEGAVIEFSLLSLPLILAYNFTDNHFLLNSIAVFGLVFFISGFFLKGNDLTQKILPSIVLFAFSLGRIVILGEEAILLDYNVWAISNLFVIIAIGFILLFGFAFKELDLTKFLGIIVVYSLLNIIFFSKLINMNLSSIESITIYAFQIFFAGSAVSIIVKRYLQDSPANLIIVGLSIPYLLISLIGNNVPFFYFGLILQIGILIWMGYKIPTDSKIYWLEILVIVIYLFTLFFINILTLIIGLVLLSYIFFLSPFVNLLDLRVSFVIRSMHRMISLAFLTVFPFILVTLDLLPLWSGLLIWYLSVVLSLISRRLSNQEILEYSIFVGVLFTLGLIMWTSLEFPQIPVIIVSLPIIFFIIYNNRQELWKSTNEILIPVPNEFSLSLTIIFLGYIVVTLRYLQNSAQLPLIDMSRYLAFISLSLLLLTVVYNKLRPKSVFSDGIIIAAFLSMLISTLFGFFDSPISNLLVGLFSLLLLITGLISKNRYIISLGVAMYLLSIFKAILDTIYLDPLGKSISWLSVGVQTIFIAIFGTKLYSSLVSDNSTN